MTTTTKVYETAGEARRRREKRRARLVERLGELTGQAESSNGNAVWHRLYDGGGTPFQGGNEEPLQGLLDWLLFRQDPRADNVTVTAPEYKALQALARQLQAVTTINGRRVLSDAEWFDAYRDEDDALAALVGVALDWKAKRPEALYTIVRRGIPKGRSVYAVELPLGWWDRVSVAVVEVPQADALRAALPSFSASDVLRALLASPEAVRAAVDMEPRPPKTSRISKPTGARRAGGGR
jgi:hypothetical protein